MSRIDRAGTVHTCDVGDGVRPRERGRALACGCRVLVHRFRCGACGRWVGWCMGADDEDSGLCDDCWCGAYVDEVDEAEVRRV